jgi:ubiquinone/menaquinone biosynthesis C-methylase UbiE
MDWNGLGRLAGSGLGLGAAGGHRRPTDVLGERPLDPGILGVMDRNGADWRSAAGGASYRGDADNTRNRGDCSIDRGGFLQPARRTERSTTDAGPGRAIRIVTPSGNAEMRRNRDAQTPPAGRAHRRTEGKMPEAWPREELEAVDRCPLCGCADRIALHRHLTDRVFFCAPGTWSLYRCGGCEGAYLDPRPTSKSIARAYSSYYTHEPEGEADTTPSVLGRLKRASSNDYLNTQYNFDLRPVLSWSRWAVMAVPSTRLKKNQIARHLWLERRGARLLDIGCGNGAFVRAARAWGWDAEGLDPDPNAAAAGRATGLPITVGSLPKVGYPDASFTAVTMSHSIEHLHDPVAGLHEIRRILQPVGTVWIATPNLSSTGHKVFGADWRGLEPPRHLVLFTAATLISTLFRAGFDQIRQVRTPFVSQWYFTSSHRIALAEDPVPTNASRLPRWLKLKATIADWQALLQPRGGEEIIIIAQRPH